MFFIFKKRKNPRLPLVRATSRSYALSNSITTVAVKRVPTAPRLLAVLSALSDHHARQSIGQQLIDELSGAAGIPPVRLMVSATNQYHRRAGSRLVMKRYGCYRPQTSLISIQNLTAVRSQILASKTFIDTLLHEWLHHYDTHKLRIRSLHTAGFYARLNYLKDILT